MSGIGEEHRHVIHTTVWSGFFGPNDMEELIEDFVLDEPELDPEALQAEVEAEMARKAKAEREWPSVTDCDRLDAAFEALPEAKILALHNAGYTMSDGHSDAAEALAQQPAGTYQGYCFYHTQDIETALEARQLFIAFDHVDGDVPEKKAIGERLFAALKAAGLKPDWDGDPGRRIELKEFSWRRRFVEGDTLWG
ncbi:DUF6891 domain-containing protein [Azorhizobium oxalatiphilum]|uniref:DUF6891 domain-containing protein n=1 Tax=Azorhizobium oxalatiphilum TaxID=980631 RepID=UPI001667CCC2|nr:hypothetical protein [Azorhizobium oxalatiphilum]